MTGLRGALDQQKTSLAEAKNDLSKLLQAEVSKGNVTMKQLGISSPSVWRRRCSLIPERPHPPGGADVLNRIGSVLKNHPDRFDPCGRPTDNVPIRDDWRSGFPPM